MAHRTVPAALVPALAAAAATVLTLTACGSSQPPAKPSARSLAAKIPGCTRTSPDMPGGTVYTQQQITCQTPDGITVQIATFASQSDERSWIIHWGAYYACCLQGSGYAALVDSPAEPDAPDWQHVEKAIGGRQVSNG